MSKLQVIGICGKARSGKDTVAAHLVHNHGFFRIALADGVRSAFSDLDGVTWERRKELEAANKTARWALQILGTECRTYFDTADHWIDHLLIKIIYMSQHHPRPQFRFVIPDIRSPNEQDVLARTLSELADLVIVGLSRPDSGLTGEQATHSSETGVDEVQCDERIVNDKGIPELRGKVDWLIHERFEQQPKQELALA